MWKPSDQDFNLLGQWLTRRPLCSNFSLLSRMVFSKLNWSCPQLLPWQRHSDLALFVIQTGATYAPDCIAGNFIQDGVRQVSKIANKLRRTPEQIWSSWAWEMVSRLRLHQNDCTLDQIEVGNSSKVPIKMVDLDLEADTLGEACATKNPLACYISLQMCQTGNVAEEFLERGVSQLNIVMSSSHYDHVLECLCHIVPLFVHRQELLIQSSSFLKLLQEVLAIDSTFLKMAKNLVLSDFPGPVLKEVLIDSPASTYHFYWQFLLFSCHLSNFIHF